MQTAIDMRGVARRSFISFRLGAVRTPQNLKNMKPDLRALRSQVEEFVAGVQEELGVLDELRYEWRRLQTFVEWPLERPRPAELAKVLLSVHAFLLMAW